MNKKLFLAITLLAATLPCMAQNGPPTYSWASTSTAVIPTPSPAPFTASTPAGTLVTDNTLSQGAQIVRLTDGKTCGGQSAFNATEGGETRDYLSNTNETVWYTPTTGGMICLVSMNPKTLQVIASSPNVLQVCQGSFKFSTVHDNVVYCMPDVKHKITVNGQPVTADGLTVYQATLPYGATGCGATNCVDVTKPLNYVQYASFATDCTEGAGLVPTWHSTLGVASADIAVSASYSTSGGQNTGHITFLENVSAANVCKTVDWLGNGVNPLIYPSLNGTPAVAINGLTGNPLQCVFSSIHGTSLAGTWLQIGYVAHLSGQGPDCVGVNDEAPILWDHTGLNFYPLVAAQQSAGHQSIDKQNWYANNIAAHPLTNLASYTIIGNISVPGCTGCYDDHFSADWLHVGNPLLGTNGGNGGELWGLPVAGGATIRFVKTYSSGINSLNAPIPNGAQNLFEDEYAIGAGGQQRTVFCWTSDMEGQLGTFLSSSNPPVLYNRSDVFCVGLSAQ